MSPPISLGPDFLHSVTAGDARLRHVNYRQSAIILPFGTLAKSLIPFVDAGRLLRLWCSQSRYKRSAMDNSAEQTQDLSVEQRGPRMTTKRAQHRRFPSRKSDFSELWYSWNGTRGLRFRWSVV